MRDKDIHIGDVLRIRQWNDMAKEFEVNDCGTITCRCGFTEDMRYLCGKQFTVSGFYEDYGEFIYISVERIEYDPSKDDEDDTWDISADMLEPFEEEDLCVANDEEIKLLFGWEDFYVTEF